MSKISQQFIQKIPKTDLHLHLDGSLRLSSLIQMAKAQRLELPSYEETGMNELVFKNRYANLGEYLCGFAYTVAFSKTLKTSHAPPTNWQKTPTTKAFATSKSVLRHNSTRMTISISSMC